MKKVVILEGHDGSGKSSIANGIVKATGARYVHFYDHYKIKYSIEPLSISEDELIVRTKAALDDALSQNENIVLDRGLITPLSVLSEERWEEFREYFNRIPTILCYADLPTTIQRLREREIDESEMWDNEKWIGINKKIAEYFDLPIIVTSSGATLQEEIEMALHIFEGL